MHFTNSLQNKNSLSDMFVNNLKYRMNSVIFRIHLQTVYKWVGNKESSLRNICFKNPISLAVKKSSSMLHGRGNEDLQLPWGSTMSLKPLGCATIKLLLFYFLDRSVFSPVGKGVLSVLWKRADRVGFLWCGSPGAGALFILFRDGKFKTLTPQNLKLVLLKNRWHKDIHLIFFLFTSRMN